MLFRLPFCFLLSENFLLILILLLLVCLHLDSDLIFSQSLLKSVNNSKVIESVGVGTKLNPLLRRRIWGSDRGLPDKLATNDLAQVIYIHL